MTRILWETPVPSTAFLEDAKFSMLSGRKCSLEYSYESETDDSLIFEKLTFEGVESFKCTYYRAGSLEMIETYDKVVDVGSSSWLTKIKHNLLEAKVLRKI